MKRITSRQNPLVARFRAVVDGGAVDLALLDGTHLVADALRAGIQVREAVVASTAVGRAEIDALTAGLVAAGVDVTAASASVMHAVSPVRSSSAIVAIADRPAAGLARMYAGTRTPLVLIAVDVQDPGNLGAIVRVADAGGATGVVAAGGSADPFGWKALRGSMGSALRLPIARCAAVRDAIEEARRNGCRIAATLPRGGEPIFAVDFRQPLALLIGSEGSGLPPDIIDAADLHVTIPMEPDVDSLNAAVTAAILVYEARRQRAQ